MLKKLFGLLLLSTFMVGCTSMKYNGGGHTSRSFDEPPLGQKTTVYVGDRMLSKGTLHEEMVLVVKKPVIGTAYQIPAGTYVQVGRDDSYTFHSAVGVTKNAFADPFSGLAYGLGKSSEVCVITAFAMRSCYQGEFKRERRSRTDEQSFQQTLLYSGRIGNKINISYREFSNDMARPAFNNDVEYDLSVSNVIGYKGASIEVLNADNSSITYRVLRNFR